MKKVEKRAKNILFRTSVFSEDKNENWQLFAIIIMYFQFANKQKEMMMIIREPSESKEQISFIIKFTREMPEILFWKIEPVGPYKAISDCQLIANSIYLTLAYPLSLDLSFLSFLVRSADLLLLLKIAFGFPQQTVLEIPFGIVHDFSWHYRLSELYCWGWLLLTNIWST
jgi:hypothetical protein